MAILYHGDCLEEMKQLDDKSVDLIFCELPYVDSKGKGQTSCSWNQSAIDLTLFWEQVMRIKKLNTPIFFTTTTKFGVNLINSAPKKCPFRYDIVWVKSACAGFLCAKKMPMRKHEMVYCFYSKLPFYDLSSHKHKFIKPPLPTSVVRESPISLKQKLDTDEVFKNKLTKSAINKDELTCETENKIENGLYGKNDRIVPKGSLRTQPLYEPPLPTSIVKEPIANEEYDKREKKTRNTLKTEENYGKGYLEKKVNFRKFDPKLGGNNAPSHLYEPPLPVSILSPFVIKSDEEVADDRGEKFVEQILENNNHIKDGQIYNGGKGMNVISDGKGHQYDPPLPNTMLEIKSTRGKHSTEKPVALMEWILKYYSKEGDVVLDPTMGSGSTGIACKNMNRNFIGIEKDEEIYEGAFNRIHDD